MKFFILINVRRIKKMNYSIFEYKKLASCNFLGGDTNSFEVKIQENGTIEYKESDFNKNTLKSEFYQLSKDGVEKIKKSIEDNWQIFDINSRLDNGSLDGYGNEFWFANEKRNRQILAWNIDNSIDNGYKASEEYLKKYGENLKQERVVLKIFFEICDILKEENFELNLYKFKTNNKSKY